MQHNAYHIPALLDDAINGLDIKASGTYVDVTFGGGGHSRAIMESLDDDGRLFGFDQDADAMANAIDDPRFTFVYSNFRYMRNFLRFHGVTAVDGILADLGVSFHHFDDPERGFSFRWEGALDMRMNRNASRSAEWYVNNFSEEQLADILYLYGELKNSRRIASAIIKARSTEPITTVEGLLSAVRPLMNPRKEKKELAQVFQALRITVNNEIEALSEFLRQSLEVLKPGGRLAVITYHSLEDRLVKNFMRSGNLEGRVEQDFYGRNLSPFRLLTSKPIVADDAEVERNPRSRSAKLRIAEKVMTP
ncbi:MAG TPA: 16S rRNA (cytosine(1402)-N(4))-methyltransferase RsmH [Muribaculum sp.]|jgi:16S rRNA (cytosine1402-N4)-methyltransferase|uniref:Ribosomal RNA small subunit methyltransferase H n=1 Tax=Heminiphilus faecis TaxID=2601703 RepID=A0ABV4CX78_9BACT|nr:16S rRNA (cytosine(1402)-N(4))-methyltransferase RsmH [Heminiphilus faecis]RLT77062.1 16S rRNA (cytosine(1402)-N(4))-methyltransferase RsmH [bacterium J10(2018)]HRF69351.1 16S rRNA (cytosine(1402)-N(4))-methyltransferase RsmH [Muribaculum sp.]